MLHKTKIGVCLDHSVAYLLEDKNDEHVITIIEADETEKKNNFYRKVFEIVKDFDKVALFGPESVKNELIHRIVENKLLNIEIQNNPIEERITENQKIEFINQYFNT